jgi:hypothetical protein
MAFADLKDRSIIVGLTLARISQCAVKRRRFSVGANPTRQLSLQPVAIGAVVDAMKPLKPPMERIT